MIVKNFYKIIFADDINNPEITPLDDDKIWQADQGGLDKSTPFILINPGNMTSANKETLPTLSDKDARGAIIFQAKIFARGVRKYGFDDEMQFLLAVNENSGKTKNAAGVRINIDLIKRHNIDPNGFTNGYTSEQARLIYGPLITQSGITPEGDGTPLDDATIIANLSKARNYNSSFGSVTANCQTNALAMLMRRLNISEATIKEGIENMRRIDMPNIAASSVDPLFPAPSGVVIEGSNDQLINALSPEKFPPLPSEHVNMDVVKIDDHRIKVYQKLPLEVYHPGKQISDEQKLEEQRLEDVSSKVFQQKLLRDVEGESKFKKITNKVIANSRGRKIIDGLGLRFKDEDTHDSPHFTGDPTRGNEVEGRDKDLSYKLMADMMTREKSKDVAGYFKPKSAVSDGHASSMVVTERELS